MSMNGKTRFFTSESVTEGHPDKVADQISDAVLDAILEKDPMGRVACETLVTTGLVVVAGEITTNCYVDIPKIVRETIKEIGYDNPTNGFDGNTCGVITSIQKQSPDIALGVDTGGAGDQGMMFGYATNETPELMPLAITLAHRITKKLSDIRRDSEFHLRPDGKSQVTVEYDGDKPVRVDTIVVSAHHSPNLSMTLLQDIIIERIIKDEHVIPIEFIDKDTKILINPTGRFEVGGPQADTGLTGRKIICDTYGGAANHGGGAFSGKDPSKVDRSAAYMARYIAKNIVAKGMAARCEIQLAYAIGIAQPVSVLVNTYGTETISETAILEYIHGNFELTPKAIISELDLRKPIYKKTASYGHFGRDGFSWERIKV